MLDVGGVDPLLLLVLELAAYVKPHTSSIQTTVESIILRFTLIFVLMVAWWLLL